MRTILDRLQIGQDLIVFDSPPLQVVADAALLSSFVHGTLLVIDASRSHRAAIRQGREALATANAHVLGVVLNRVPEQAQSRDQMYYGYYRGTGQDPGQPTTPTLG